MDIQFKEGSLQQFLAHVILLICKLTGLFTMLIIHDPISKTSVKGVLWRGWWWENENIKKYRDRENYKFAKRHLNLD